MWRPQPGRPQVPDFVRLRRVIAEYGPLRTLDGMTAQARGQRFNAVVAEMLGCWGIERERLSGRPVRAALIR